MPCHEGQEYGCCSWPKEDPGQHKCFSEVSSLGFISQDKLQDGSFTNSIYRITSNLGVVIAGMPADARALVNRARQTASE